MICGRQLTIICSVDTSNLFKEHWPMRQPVCVGCDGRELLTLNSVTAPLTEPHLNAHKRSPKSFRGGPGWGPAQESGQGEVSTPRGERAKPKNLDNVMRAQGFPALVPCQRSHATNAPPGGTPSHEQWTCELQIQHQSLCRRTILVFTSSK